LTGLGKAKHKRPISGGLFKKNDKSGLAIRIPSVLKWELRFMKKLSWYIAGFKANLEKISHGSIWQTRYLCLPFAVAVSTLVLTQTALPIWQRLVFFGMGVLNWTLLEYVLHRWVLHWRPRNEKVRAVVESIHIVHHNDPTDDSIVCISLLNSLFLWSLVFGFWVVAFGLKVSLLVTSGTSLMMVIYDITHYSTHYMKPTNWLLKRLRNYHLKHHFVDHDTRFGVTSPLWDYVFRTRSEKL
jgi:hypothetical protein